MVGVHRGLRQIRRRDRSRDRTVEVHDGRTRGGGAEPRTVASLASHDQVARRLRRSVLGTRRPDAEALPGATCRLHRACLRSAAHHLMTQPGERTNAVEHPRHRYWPLYAAGFVTAFGAHSIAANLGTYGQQHHASLLTIGLLLAVYDAAEVVLKPVFGTLVDRVGPRPVLLGGLIAFACASTAFVIAGDPGLLGLARLGQGAAAAAFSPA